MEYLEVGVSDWKLLARGCEISMGNSMDAECRAWVLLARLLSLLAATPPDDWQSITELRLHTGPFLTHEIIDLVEVSR